MQVSNQSGDIVLMMGSSVGSEGTTTINNAGCNLFIETGASIGTAYCSGVTSITNSGGDIVSYRGTVNGAVGISISNTGGNVTIGNNSQIYQTAPGSADVSISVHTGDIVVDTASDIQNITTGAGSTYLLETGSAGNITISNGASVNESFCCAETDGTIVFVSTTTNPSHVGNVTISNGLVQLNDGGGSIIVNNGTGNVVVTNNSVIETNLISLNNKVGNTSVSNGSVLYSLGDIDLNNSGGQTTIDTAAHLYAGQNVSITNSGGAVQIDTSNGGFTCIGSTSAPQITISNDQNIVVTGNTADAFVLFSGLTLQSSAGSVNVHEADLSNLVVSGSAASTFYVAANQSSLTVGNITTNASGSPRTDP